MSLKTFEHPCDVAGWVVFEYADKGHSTLFYWRDADGISSDFGFETAALANANAVQEHTER